MSRFVRCRGYGYHVYALGADRCSICGAPRYARDACRKNSQEWRDWDAMVSEHADMAQTSEEKARAAIAQAATETTK